MIVLYLKVKSCDGQMFEMQCLYNQLLKISGEQNTWRIILYTGDVNIWSKISCKPIIMPNREAKHFNIV
jgi:hypothetical protein